MWLSSSSVGRKFVMACSGAFLVLFVTFHCLMNSVAICWPAAYNSICEFLGANWYALIASVILAAFIIVHIIYACILTMQNRQARGSQRYAISKRPAGVEWTSQNMFVLGIVILAFLVVHLIQFWARMQLQEIRGCEEALPPAAGTLFLQEAFQLVWTPIVYIIGFIALWLHMNHGFWSMFQSVGWDSTIWIPRLKKIAVCWSSIVVLLFIAQAIVFTVKAHQGYYKTDPTLREQYKEMVAAMKEKDFGPDAAQVLTQIKSMPYEVVAQQLPQAVEQMKMQKNMPGFEQQLEANPDMARQFNMNYEIFNSFATLIEYLDGNNIEVEGEVVEVVEPEMSNTPNN
ncbi:MAG: succinate dehydrogenase cytochrome b subunit [Muribaculaceae bacterium]|nr:succinate dehydrogenase cytochrome b subunit [Bacteroides sp.]MDE6804398.1 succinate dehydrogenase cytochrome b subunit [Muribaculaceae bacterium]MDE6842727.1 succinate dehydrogenase cytochrome b subunit [Muribaculaceae bacterium]MDE7190224.1 succinate dehydrogenase cytochrome b subunit [Muribaculaceae bacterium]